jgi:hypothetical protein
MLNLIFLWDVRQSMGVTVNMGYVPVYGRYSDYDYVPVHGCRSDRQSMCVTVTMGYVPVYVRHSDYGICASLRALQ